MEQICEEVAKGTMSHVRSFCTTKSQVPDNNVSQVIVTNNTNLVNGKPGIQYGAIQKPKDEDSIITPEDIPNVIRHRSATQEEDENFRNPLFNGNTPNTTYFEKGTDLSKRVLLQNKDDVSIGNSNVSKENIPNKTNASSSQVSKPFDLKKLEGLMKDPDYSNILKELKK